MNQKMFIIGTAVLLLTIGLNGCIGSGENPIIGTWVIYDFEDPFNIKIEYSFFENQKFLQLKSYLLDNTQINKTFLGEYEISENILKMTYENNLPVKKIQFTFNVQNDTLIITNRKIFPVQSKNLTRVSFEPVQDWPIDSKSIKASPNSLVLDIDDLSEGYKICHNDTDEPGREVDPIDSFSRIFTKEYENCSDFEEGLISIIMIFTSSFDASIYYNDVRLPVFYQESHKIINNSVNTIGDESFAHYYLGEKLNESQIYYWFRISNLVCLIKVPYDYTLLQNLVDLVEQRIYDNMS